MDEDDTIPVEPLTGWEIAVNMRERRVIFRLRSLADAQAPLEQARSHACVVAPPATILQLAHDLLSALRKLDAQGPAQSGLEGSQRERQE